MHRMLSLYAALNVGTGEVKGMTAARHTSQEFVAFLDHVVESQPRRHAIHLILDNFSAHKTKSGRGMACGSSASHDDLHADLCLVLNQVELWFAKIERECIARGIFTSAADLRRKLMQYIRTHNKHCHPFAWSYADPSHQSVSPPIELHSTLSYSPP